MITKNAINNGVFMGVTFIVSSYMLYLVDNQSFIALKSSILFLVFLLLLYKTGTDARRQNGGIISYSTVFKDLFFAAIIGTFLCSVFEYLLFNFIDPSLKEQVKETFYKAAEEMQASGNKDLYQKLVNTVKAEDIYSITYCTAQFFVRIFMPCALFSALLAFLIRRN